MVGEINFKQNPSLPDGMSYVGFKSMVAPVNQNVQTTNKNAGNSPRKRHVSELLGSIHARTQVAPGFSDCIRFLLEQQKIGDEEIRLAIKQLGPPERYDRPFKKLYVILQDKGIDPLKASIMEIASAILQLSEISIPEARNAYSAVCLLPGFESIRFCPVLKRLKSLWNQSTQKYATFWDPAPVLRKLITQKPLESLSVPELRNRLILLFRLLSLHRGIDLARTQRTISMVGDKAFVLVQRKGWKCPRWEQVVRNDKIPTLSPFHVMIKYVQKTAHLVPPGSPLLCSLDGKRPLSSDRINSLTKNLLCMYGVPPQWTAHSTRGAGVKMYKALGFTSEEVCEIGQWKNSSAFTAHYLRLGAVEKVNKILSNVHKTSPPESAEPEWLQTPGRNDQGGSNQEGEAQEGGEPTQPTPKRKPSNSPPRRRKRQKEVRSGPLTFKFSRPVSETTSSPTPAPPKQ